MSEQAITRKQLLEYLNVKNDTLKKIIKDGKLKERLARLGYNYIRTDKVGRNSLYIIEEKQKFEDINSYNGLLSNLLNIKATNGSKFAMYLMYRYMNAEQPITKSFIADKIKVNVKTISDWDNKLIDLGLLDNSNSYYIEITEDEVKLVDELDYKGYWTTIGFIKNKKNTFKKSGEILKDKLDNKENDTYAREVTNALYKYLNTDEFKTYENDVKDRYIISVNRYKVDYNNQLIKDLLQYAKNIYNLNPEEYYVEWKKIKDLLY